MVKASERVLRKAIRPVEWRSAAQSDKNPLNAAWLMVRRRFYD